MSKIANAVLRRVGQIAVAIGLVLLSAVVAGRAQPASGTVVVHEAFPSKNAAFWPNFVATSLGLYAKEGIEVQPIIVDPNVSVSTLIGGSAEISYADTTQLLLALEKGANLVAVGLSPIS
jgi:ABC-type nitrate/sulfonate/bicarbonate transport system substrate-binding protein